MICSSCSHFPKAVPLLSSSSSSSSHCKVKIASISTLSKQIHPHYAKPEKKIVSGSISFKPIGSVCLKSSNLAIQVGTLLTTFGQPAFAVTGVNYEEDFTWILIQLGISAFLYFLVAPPFIMNWLRVRWYKRNFFEMFVQFMFVFLFFPGLLLWAPFLNFRKLPRDPSMKYPWSTPQEPSKIRNSFRKYPWAKPEDYEVY